MTNNNNTQHASSQEDTWRLFRIMAEFVEGFETLSRLGPCITIFGSARTRRNHPYYKMAVDTAKIAAINGYGVITGGGPGIMEAANKGAAMGKGKSIGLNIQLPAEQVPNKYIRYSINFRHFFCRKVMFLKYTSAVIIMPGGYGTLDEMFETLTLVQTQKIGTIAIVLMGKAFWRGILKWMKTTLLDEYKYISPEDLALFKLTDDPAEAIEYISAFENAKKVQPNFE